MGEHQHFFFFDLSRLLPSHWPPNPSTDEITASGGKGKTMASKQITMWLQGLFLFSVVWSLGGTITGDSRKKFDLYYRSLIKGEDKENPRPAGIKLQDKNLFPEKGRN